MFNPKAWSNADLMLEWIKYMYTPSSKYPLFPRYSTVRPPRLLSLDVFSGQKIKEVIASFKSLKFTTSFIPGGTTDFIQVCDTVINKSLKARIEELADQYIDENEREWGPSSHQESYEICRILFDLSSSLRDRLMISDDESDTSLYNSRTLGCLSCCLLEPLFTG